MEKTVNENRDRLPAADIERIEAAIKDVRDAVGADNLEAIKNASDALQKASHAMAEQLYKQTQANAEHAQNAAGFQSGAASPNQSHDDVKDGEVVDA